MLQNDKILNLRTHVNFLITSTKLAFFHVYSNLRRWVVIQFLHINAVHLGTGGRVIWTHWLPTSSLTFFAIYSLNKSFFPLSNKSEVNYYHRNFPERKHALVINIQTQREKHEKQYSFLPQLMVNMGSQKDGQSDLKRLRIQHNPEWLQSRANV